MNLNPLSVYAQRAGIGNGGGTPAAMRPPSRGAAGLPPGGRLQYDILGSRKDGWGCMYMVNSRYGGHATFELPANLRGRLAPDLLPDELPETRDHGV